MRETEKKKKKLECEAEVLKKEKISCERQRKGEVGTVLPSLSNFYWLNNLRGVGAKLSQQKTPCALRQRRYTSDAVHESM